MNLQPLNICLSYMQTLRYVNNTSEHHDNIEVQYWADELKQGMQLSTVSSLLYV